jgi:hypothetical protein
MILKLTFFAIIIVVMIFFNQTSFKQNGGLVEKSGTSYWSSTTITQYDHTAVKDWSQAFFISLSIAAFAFVGVEITAATALEARVTGGRTPTHSKTIGRTVCCLYLTLSWSSVRTRRWSCNSQHSMESPKASTDELGETIWQVNDVCHCPRSGNEGISSTRSYAKRVLNGNSADECKYKLIRRIAHIVQFNEEPRRRPWTALVYTPPRVFRQNKQSQSASTSVSGLVYLCLDSVYRCYEESFRSPRNAGSDRVSWGHHCLDLRVLGIYSFS